MPTDPKHGIDGALDDLGARAPLPGELADQDEAVEADMFADAPALPLVLVPGPDGDAFKAQPTVRKGPGRPKGSRNRTTEQRVKYLEQRFGHPLDRLAELASIPIPVLAATYKMTMAEAAELNRKYLNDLMPYMAQKLPQLVDLKTTSAGVLQVFLGAPPVEGQNLSDQGIPIQLVEGEIKTVENQTVSNSEDKKSDDESRKDDSK